MGRKIVRYDDIVKSNTNNMSERKTNEDKLEEMYVKSDHPNAMENGTATALYILVMLIGTIFQDRWLIYIMASWIYFRFINRRVIRKKQWDKMQEEKKNGGNQ